MGNLLPHTSTDLTISTLCLTCLVISQIYPLPTLQSQKREKGPKEKQKDQAIDYYPPSPRYIPSHEEDAPIPAPEKEKVQKIRKLDMSKLKNPTARKLNILTSHAASCRDNYYHD